MVIKQIPQRFVSLALISGYFFIADTFAQDSHYEQEQMSNIGELHLSGSITEGACRLSMLSENQLINLGNIASSELSELDEAMAKSDFNIELYDCGSSTRYFVLNSKTGTQIATNPQSSVTIRFMAPTLDHDSALIRVSGIKGIALKMTTQDGKAIKMGETQTSVILNPRKNILTYTITPVRTAEPLQAGKYDAVIVFELTYH